MQNLKNWFNTKNKRNWRKSFRTGKSLSKFKKYCSRDDFEHKNLTNVRNLFNGIALNEVAFNQSIDEDYYKPIRTESVFNSNYVEYENKGDKDKNLSPKEYLDMIRPYSSDIINVHKTPKKSFN